MLLSAGVYPRVYSLREGLDARGLSGVFLYFQ